MKDILRAIITFLRRLPIAAWIKPLWKGALRAVVQSEGDALQARLRAAIEAEGVKAVDRNIDKWQADLKAAISRLPLPSGIRDSVRRMIQDHGDELQTRLRGAITAGGPAAVDAAFDTAQAALLLKIDAL